LLLLGGEQINRVERRDNFAANDELLEIIEILERLVIQKTQPKFSAIGLRPSALEDSWIKHRRAFKQRLCQQVPG
jgi:hypothetical protein